MSCFSTMSAVTAASEFDLTKHVNYTAGMILGVDDFTQEFAYLGGRDRWMAREALGYGTISGLRVRVESGEAKPRVMVEPGVAISPRGQLICVPTAQCAYLNEWLAAAKPEELSEWLKPVNDKDQVITSPPRSQRLKLYVVLCYRDCLTDNAPIPGEPCRNENELMAASRVKDDYSLELRFEPPKQPEEDAVRRYSDFLRAIEISDDISSTRIDEFLGAIRAEFLPLARDESDFEETKLQIHPADVAEYMRLAFRLWTTELRNVLSEKETGCAVEMTGGGKLDDCILLAELRVPLTSFAPGWKVSDGEEVELIQDNRPFLLHLRMLQEWMLNEPNDHGHLTGLEDDDHPQYLLINGNRAMSGNLKMGGNNITNLAKGINPMDAVNFSQAIKVDDLAGGDLTGKYPKPTIASLQTKPVSAGAPTEGQVLIFKGGKWIAEKQDHGELNGLGDDDHRQYLLVDGTRAMSGNLNLGAKQITNLARGNANGHAVTFEQAVKIDDLTTDGDLSGRFSKPKIERLQGKTVSAETPVDGQVLTYKGDKWIPEKPASGGVIAHKDLTGLTSDDHPQYLLADGARTLTGDLKLGGKKITGLANGVVASDAATVGQTVKSTDVAGGDMSGKFSDLRLEKIHGRKVTTILPKAGEALVFNGSEWTPQPQSQTAQINILPLATINRIGNNLYEIWFNIDAPRNAAQIEKIVSDTDLTVEGEDNKAPFLTKIPGSLVPTANRNIFNFTAQLEMPYMRFTFHISKIQVKPLLGISVSLATYAKNNSIRFMGSEADETATVFVRVINLGLK